MSAQRETSVLCWNGHANNLSIRFMELLCGKELVDVTLVADGKLFSAHRLILSAISPKFRKIFNEMPANQHAYVFMNDVPKETVEDLITYMYNGQVEIQQELLADFLKNAKSLEIEGISENSYQQTIGQDQPVSSNWNNHSNHGRMQYQTTQINRVETSKMVHNENSTIIASGSAYQTNTNKSNHRPYQYSNGSNFSDDLNGSTYDAYESNGYNGNDSDLNFGMESVYCDASMNQDYDGGNVQWDHEYEDNGQEFYENQDVAANTSGAPVTKRARHTNAIDTFEYDTVADVRSNGKNGENLFYANAKYNKVNKLNAHGQQRWQCSKRTNKCRAACSTMDVNGTMMMKVLVAEHNHELMD